MVPAIIPLLDKLKSNPGVGKFSTKATSGSGLRVQCEDLVTHNAILTALAEEGTHLHTHQLRSEKGYRIILRHIHHTTPCEWIAAKLEQLGFVARFIRGIKHRFTGRPLNIFEIELQTKADGSHEDILNLKELGSQSVAVERQVKPRDPVQCHRCQAFGHTKNYCRRPFVCMKCAGEHMSTACTKPRQVEPKCANCKGNHISCYKGCPAYKNARSKLRANRVMADDKQRQEREQRQQPLPGIQHPHQIKPAHQQSRALKQPGVAKLSYSQVVRNGNAAGRVRNPAEIHLATFQQQLRLEQQQNQLPNPPMREQQISATNNASTPNSAERSTNMSHSRLVSTIRKHNPKRKLLGTLQRPLRRRQNQQQHRSNNSRKPATSSINKPATPTNRDKFTHGQVDYSAPLRNSFGSHLATPQQHQWDEQQQQAGHQSSMSKSTILQTLEQNMAMFSRMEKRMDTLLNVLVQFITIHNENNTTNTNNHVFPNIAHQQTDSKAAQMDCSREAAIANDVTKYV